VHQINQLPTRSFLIMTNFDHISHFHKDQLLHVVSYHMRSDMQRIMMRECPAAYNALCGRIVVTSQVEDTGRKIIERPTDVDLKDFD
jgi:hypothetical protein